MDTKIDRNRKVPYALTAIKEVGRRFTFAVCRKADVNIDRKTSRMARTHKLVLSNNLESKYRDEFEHMKKIHYWGLRVRGQHTKTTGRKGRPVGVSKKKSG
uniref:Small ribosomal subunit protein uS13 n=1 Tax=Ditylenchus dipsaci TaxID=166011 RepID=A0A915DFP4_9BILA